MKTHLIRTRFGKDIVAEVQLPERQTGKIAILASGLPATPPRRVVFDFLGDKGYVVIAFRYRGAWESGGVFLEHSPADDVTIVIDTLIAEKQIMDLYNEVAIPITVKKIHLFGNSFGGPAVLLNSKHKAVNKVVALSPVLDWRKESKGEPFQFFIRFTEKAFGSAYRVAHRNVWQKLIDTPLYDPTRKADHIDPKKVFIIGTADDEVTPSSEIKTLRETLSFSYYIKPKGGHLSFTDLTNQFYWKKIKAFLDKK